MHEHARRKEHDVFGDRKPRPATTKSTTITSREPCREQEPKDVRHRAKVSQLARGPSSDGHSPCPATQNATEDRMRIEP